MSTLDDDTIRTEISTRLGSWDESLCASLPSSGKPNTIQLTYRFSRKEGSGLVLLPSVLTFARNGLRHCQRSVALRLTYSMFMTGMLC